MAHVRSTGLPYLRPRGPSNTVARAGARARAGAGAGVDVTEPPHLAPGRRTGYTLARPDSL